MTIEELEKRVAAKIRQTYPETVWPDPPDDKKAKDAVAAHILRTIGAQIAENFIENELELYLSGDIKLLEICKIPEEEGGGYCASVPEFAMYLLGDGETEQEALKHLYEFIDEESKLKKKEMEGVKLLELTEAEIDALDEALRRAGSVLPWTDKTANTLVAILQKLKADKEVR